MLRIVLVILACCQWTATAVGQDEKPKEAPKQLLGGSVDLNDPKYRDVTDAVALFQLKKGAEAIEKLRLAVKEHPELPPAEIMYAHLCFASNLVENGYQMLEAAAVRHENDPEAWIMLGDLAVRGQRFAEADVLLQRGLLQANLLPDSDRKLRLRTNAMAGLTTVDEKRRLWDRAAGHLKQLLNLQPENHNLMHRLAVTDFHRGRVQEALQLLNEVQELAPKRVLPEVVLGLLYQQTGQSEEAENMMLDALKRAPDDVVTRLSVGEWALSRGRTALAEENANFVMTRVPNSERARIIKAGAFQFRGDYLKAETLLKQILADSPASFAASNELACALLAQPATTKHQRASQHARVNVDRYQDLRTRLGREAAATYAWSQHKLNNNPAAMNIIRRVLSAGEISPRAGYFSACILRAGGEIEAAKTLMQKSLASDASFPERKMAERIHARTSKNSDSKKQPEEK